MKIIEWIAHALRWMLESAFLVVALMVILSLAIIMVVEMSMRSPENNPNSTENKFKVACQAVNGAAVWNGKNWECIK